MDPINAPWTEEQVEALNLFQSSGIMHPFTCGADDCRRTLVAHEDGWHCPRTGCTYHQDWAHGGMADRQAILTVLTERLRWAGRS